MQDLTREKKSEIEVLDINFFYNLFQKEKRQYSPSLFGIKTKNKSQRKVELPLAVFRKIILNYLTVYFYNMYMKNVSLYFPLGGFMKKVVYDKWIFKNSKGSNEGKNSIGFFWYMRPSMKMYFMVKFVKLTGSTSQMAKLEKLYLQNNDKDLLPIFIQEFIKGKKHKTLYRCTQT